MVTKNNRNQCSVGFLLLYVVRQDSVWWIVQQPYLNSSTVKFRWRAQSEKCWVIHLLRITETFLKKFITSIRFLNNKNEKIWLVRKQKVVNLLGCFRERFYCRNCNEHTRPITFMFNRKHFQYVLKFELKTLARFKRLPVTIS